MYSNVITLWSVGRQYVVDRFLYSAILCSDQTHCALVACDSELVTVASYSAFLNIHASGVLTVLFGRCMAGAT